MLGVLFQLFFRLNEFVCVYLHYMISGHFKWLRLFDFSPAVLFISFMLCLTTLIPWYHTVIMLNSGNVPTLFSWNNKYEFTCRNQMAIDGSVLLVSVKLRRILLPSMLINISVGKGLHRNSSENPAQPCMNFHAAAIAWIYTNITNYGHNLKYNILYIMS